MNKGLHAIDEVSKQEDLSLRSTTRSLHAPDDEVFQSSSSLYNNHPAGEAADKHYDKVREEMLEMRALITSLESKIDRLEAASTRNTAICESADVSIDDNNGEGSREEQDTTRRPRNFSFLFRSYNNVRKSDEEEKGKAEIFHKDTFTLMMLSRPCSKSWALGLTAFTFQMTLGIWIAIAEIRLPYSTDISLQVGQLMTIFLCLATQSDIMTSIGTYTTLRINRHWCKIINLNSNQNEDTTVDNGNEQQERSGISPRAFYDLSKDSNTIAVTADKQKDNLTWDDDALTQRQSNQNQEQLHNERAEPASGTLLRCWALRVFLPNFLKLIQGLLVLFISFIVIITSDNIIDLLKDFTALIILSEIDNMMFYVAEHGFFGEDLFNKVEQAKNADVDIDGDDVDWKRTFVIRRFVLFIMTSAMTGGWYMFFNGQRSGDFFFLQYPYCEIGYEEISLFGNGICDGGIMNTIDCDFDGGDCLSFNLAYPSCNAAEPWRVGDEICDEQYNTLECDFDGSDCCPYSPDSANVSIELSERLNDGVCDGGQYSTQKCKFDEGDCDDFRRTYFDCELNELASLVDADNPPRLGDGICETSIYNNEFCGFEYGDCIECNALVSDISNFELTGDGTCHGGAHNSAECNYDLGDCEEFNSRYPQCAFDTRGRPHSAVPIIGDGICNSGLYNNPECGYEDGDCLACNDLVDDITKIGDGVCDGQNYMSIECGLDGGDCSACTAPRFEIGNGWCTPEYNTPECSFDGGDCLISQVYYDCEVPLPSLLGNGYCNGGIYDTEACGFDGGDCEIVLPMVLMSFLSVKHMKIPIQIVQFHMTLMRILAMESAISSITLLIVSMMEGTVPVPPPRRARVYDRYKSTKGLVSNMMTVSRVTPILENMKNGKTLKNG